MPEKLCASVTFTLKHESLSTPSWAAATLWKGSRLAGSLLDSP